jgi:signal transduction histidine kinase
MRAMAVAGAGGALLLLLTWLLLRGFGVDARPYEQAFAALDDIELSESTLHRDVLNARAGLLRNYDPLVQQTARLEEAVARLRGSVAKAALVDRLDVWLARQEELVEEFKSTNALLQNSLAQFGPLSSRAAMPDDDAAARDLASAMLQFMLNTSPEAGREVERGLRALAAQAGPAAAEPVTTLLAHGWLLHDLMPAADRVLRTIVGSSSRPEREAIRAAVLAGREAAERRARGYRLLLYGVSVLLLGGLLLLGLQLRSRALALRRHAAFEHVLADISTRLITTDAGGMAPQLKQALARIAGHVGADRAWLVLTGAPQREFTWSREGAGFPTGWPAQAPSLAARRAETPEGIIRQCGEEGGWIAAVRRSNGQVTALLGCDVLGRRPAAASEMGPLGLALDALVNVVERADIERERARLEARVEQSRRMATLGAFASGIAHNFNNLLGAILGYTEMAEEEVGTGGAAAPRLAEIRRAGERARDLVDQILAFGRHRDLVRRALSARLLMAETESLLRAWLPGSVEIAIGDVPECAWLYGDATQLQQVVANLCSNAAQAMDGVGTITIRVEERMVTHPCSVSHGVLDPNRYLVISVSDTGSGMDAATISRIFEPFFTTRESGHGLGLATVREIVQGHGGAIHVWSEPAVGSRFEIWLPCAGLAGAVASSAIPGTPVGQGEVLLLLDTDARRLLGEEELLAALGYEPVGVATLGDALQALRAASGRFDAAVVCQADMRAALGLVSSLRGEAPGLPVLLATQPVTGPGVEELASSGIAEVLPWPLGAAGLGAALKRCLAMPNALDPA